MKRKDITTEMVLLAYLECKETILFPYDIIINKTKAPFKVVYAAMERDYLNDYIECGVTLRSGWVTEKGIEYLKKLGYKI